MQIGILGSGMVGRAIAGKLSELGYDVVIGSRDVAALMARTESDGMGNPPFGSWLQNHPAVRVGDFREAAAQGEILFNCTNGRGALDALAQAGEAHLNNPSCHLARRRAGAKIEKSREVRKLIVSTQPA